MRNINSISENAYSEQMNKFKRWSLKYDYTHTYIIGHENPLPDGDCICSANGFAHTITYIQNRLKKSGSLLNKVSIMFKAFDNPYINKVLNYVNECERTMRATSKYSMRSIENVFAVSRDGFIADIWTVMQEHKKTVEEIKPQNGKLGLAFFVLDTDYKRTGYEEFLDQLPMTISKLQLEMGLTGPIGVDVFFGIIDHHLPKDDDNLPKNFVNAYGKENTLELVFPSTLERTGASSTAEIIMNILSTEQDSFKYYKNYNLTDEENEIANIKVVSTICKILLGGMRTDTGNFVFSGHGSSLQALSELIQTYNLQYNEDIEVSQNLIGQITEPKKDPMKHHIYSYLHNKVTFVRNSEAQYSGIAYMIVNNNHFEEEEHLDSILRTGIKPIHVLQEYDYNAACALSYDKKDRTLKLEIRSIDAKYNCREFAQSVHSSGGGHLQAAGVTITVPDNIDLIQVINETIQKFVEFMSKVDNGPDWEFNYKLVKLVSTPSEMYDSK